MGTYGTATPLKINAAISNQSAASTTLWTASANACMWINICMVGTGTGTVSIGGRTVAVHANTTSSAGRSNALTTSSFPPLYVGPSQGVNFTLNSGAVTCYISGVEFINS